MRENKLPCSPLVLACLTWATVFVGAAGAQPLSLLPPTQEALPPPAVAPPSAEPVLPPGETHDTWFDNGAWWPCLGWEGGVELGLNGSTGNSDTFNIRAGANATRKTEHNKFTADIAYNQSSDNNVETKNNAQFNARDEILLGDSPWTLFSKVGLEYDEFKAFDLRLALNAGVGYRWIKNDTTNFTTRLGAGVSHEFGGPDDAWTPEAVFGLDFEHQLTKMQKLTAKAEYLPEWSDFQNFRVVSDVAWVMALDCPQKLSLKLSVNDEYDSSPNGAKPNDLNYSALLLWKF